MAMAMKEDSMLLPQKKLEKLFSMKGGKGETSYAKNSQAQAKHARSMLHLLEGALDGMKLPSPESLFTVADLGCSSGENTLFIIKAIVKHMAKRYKAAGTNAPEFQAFFSDLPSNDFNTLFQLLPQLPGNGNLEHCLTSDETRCYYAAGVPGSFYGRLFPSETINIFYSAFSLQWLSQVPESVMERCSPAYNRGRVFLHGASELTASAYRKQFQVDFSGFLRCRSRELKKDGCMFLAFVGRTSQDPRDQGGAGVLFGTHFQEAWNDLVLEGLLEAEKRDSFNIPVYAPSLQDFREVVEADGSFHINKLEIFRGGCALVVSHPNDPSEVGRAFTNSCRSLCGVLVDAHIGEQLSQVLFSRLESRATSHAKELLDQLHLSHIVASLSLFK